MPEEILFTTEEAAVEIGTYSKLISYLAALHDVPRKVAAQGRITLFDRDSVALLRDLVLKHKNRPRINPSKITA